MPPSASTKPAMLTIEEAVTAAAAVVTPVTAAETVPLHRASGRRIASPVHARFDAPFFDNAAMDGYAVALPEAGLSPGDVVPVLQRIRAGDAAEPLLPGTAARIFTGAPLPAGADAVVRQEDVVRVGDDIRLARPLRHGANCRRRGEDVTAGDLLAPTGTRLGARHVGLLAAQGYVEARVLKRPRIAVLSTGNEILKVGERPDGARIHDANRPMLMALVTQAGAEALDGGWSSDDADGLARRLLELSERADLILTTGGASVGEEDHSAAAALKAGGAARTVHLAVKPGKPLVIGRIGSAGYLGLPGNPVAAAVAWFLVASAAAARLQGDAAVRRAGLPVPIAAPLARQQARTELRPASLVTLPDGRLVADVSTIGGPARLKAFADASGLVEIPPGETPFPAGTPLPFHAFGETWG